MCRRSKSFVQALIILQVCIGGIILFYTRTREQAFTATTSAEEPFALKHLLLHYASSPKDLQSLDEQYNITRVKGYRDKLKNVKYLDNFYYYNQKAVGDSIKARMEKIERVCESMDNSYSVKDNLYQINEFGVTWCPVFKSGSTTWKNYFIDKLVLKMLSNLYNSLDILKSRKLKYRTITAHGKQHYKDECVNNIRFTVVRHPLLRLASHVHNAAKDSEMVAMETSWIYNAVVHNREDAIENSTLKKLYLEEFDDYFKWLKRKAGTHRISDNNPFLNPPHPRLDDLVSYIKRYHRSNGHWTPAWDWCNVCANKFNYIIKLEEQPLELWFLIDKLGLWADREVFLTQANSSPKTENQTENTTLNIESLNIMLDNDQRKWVNEYFRYDFKLFGYDQLELLM